MTGLRLLLSVLLPGMLGLAASAEATPLNVSEEVFVEKDYVDGILLGSLDVGVNRISGVTCKNQCLLFDTDSFRVSLPSGLFITSIQLSVVGGFDFPGSGITLLSPNSGSASFDANGTYTVSPFAILSSPIGFEIVPGADPEQPYPWWDIFNYTLAITVAPVPEPSTLTLVALGLPVLARLAARRMGPDARCARRMRRA